MSCTIIKKENAPEIQNWDSASCIKLCETCLAKRDLSLTIPCVRTGAKYVQLLHRFSVNFFPRIIQQRDFVCSIYHLHYSLLYFLSTNIAFARAPSTLTSHKSISWTSYPSEIHEYSRSSRQDWTHCQYKIEWLKIIRRISMAIVVWLRLLLLMP